jgi:hypothetical protein
MPRLDLLPTLQKAIRFRREHFPEKWMPVFRPKMQKIINLEPRFDSIKIREALDACLESLER